MVDSPLMDMQEVITVRNEGTYHIDGYIKQHYIHYLKHYEHTIYRYIYYTTFINNINTIIIPKVKSCKRAFG